MSPHVQDFMARACANSLGTITQLEKMAAFFKSFVWCLVYGENEGSHRKRYKEIFTLAPSTTERHILFCTLGFKVCTIGEKSA